MSFSGLSPDGLSAGDRRDPRPSLVHRRAVPPRAEIAALRAAPALRLLHRRRRGAVAAGVVVGSSPMSGPAVHKGGCACGRVSIEARGEPYRVGVCHCLTCRKLHGMPFSFYAVFPPDAVTITGKVDVFASSEHGRRYFCPACGSQVCVALLARRRDLRLSRLVRRDRDCGSRPTNCGRSGETRGSPRSRASSAATRKTGRNGAGRSLDPSDLCRMRSATLLARR